MPGALEAYHEAEKRLSNSALVNQYIAIAERRLGHWREAQAHITRATELDPRNARLWTTAELNIFRPLRRWAEAEAALDRALEISPNDQYAISLKVQLFQDQGRLDEAAKELARLTADPSDKNVLSTRIQQDLLKREFDQAISRARQVTNSLVPGKPLTPPDILILILQGYAQKWSGHNEDARRTFERIIEDLEQCNCGVSCETLAGDLSLPLPIWGGR